jgi:hypothetical protein|nr:MAG: hypothetical protein DIU52_07035 [bacterium]
MPSADHTQPGATLERALSARVAVRTTAAGRGMQPAAVERIMRAVLDRRHLETQAGRADRDPAVRAFVGGTGHGERGPAESRSMRCRTEAQRAARRHATRGEP